MIRVADVISILLLAGAIAAFVAGLYAIADRRDLVALYCVVVGGLALRASINLLRPRTGVR